MVSALREVIGKSPPYARAVSWLLYLYAYGKGDSPEVEIVMG